MTCGALAYNEEVIPEDLTYHRAGGLNVFDGGQVVLLLDLFPIASAPLAVGYHR